MLKKYECDRLIIEIDEDKKTRRVIIKTHVATNIREIRLFRAGCPDKKCRDNCILRR